MKTSRRARHRITLKDFGALSYGVVVGRSPASPEPPHSQAGATTAGTPDRSLPSRGPVASPAPATRQPGSDETPTPPPRPKAVKAHLLVADDTPSVRDSLAKLLRAEGYEVDVAANGRQALDQYDPRRTDLVLLDLDMPAVHGWDTFEKLMELKADQAIIIITGKVEPSGWVAAGPDGLLFRKPIDVPALLDSIRRVLREPEASRRERIAVQRMLARHTRPLPEALRWPSYLPGGLNE